MTEDGRERFRSTVMHHNEDHSNLTFTNRVRPLHDLLQFAFGVRFVSEPKAKLSHVVATQFEDPVLFSAAGFAGSTSWAKQGAPATRIPATNASAEIARTHRENSAADF